MTKQQRASDQKENDQNLANRNKDFGQEKLLDKEMFKRSSKKGVYGISNDESDEELVKLDNNQKRKRKKSDDQESDFDSNKKPRRANLDPDKMFKSGSDYDEISVFLNQLNWQKTP